MLAPVTITNPNVAANTPITIPGGLAVESIVSASLLDTGNYPDASAVAPVALSVQSTIPPGGLAAGQIALASPSQIQLGNATNDGYQTVVLTVRLLGDRPKTTYSTSGSRGGRAA
jgi:hypothetical protein